MLLLRHGFCGIDIKVGSPCRTIIRLEGKDLCLAYASLLLYMLVLFIRPQEWMAPLRELSILDWIVGATLVLYLAALAGRRTMKPLAAPESWLMLGLFFAMLMSHVRHTYLGGFLYTFQEFGKVLLLYFLIATLVDRVPRTKILILTMIAGCLFMAVHGILQAHTGVGFGGALPIIVDGVTRVRAFGFFHDPNDLALMLVAILPFLMSKALDAQAEVPARFLSVGAMIPVVYCIFLTNSRGGWLAFGAMLIAYACIHVRRKKLAVAVGALAFALVLALGPSRIHGLNTSDRSTLNRLAAWADGNAMLKRWPVFGAGWRRFTEFSEEDRVAHNSFVHCWGELGLFGYFFWLGLIIASVKDGLALSKVEPDGPEQRALSRLARAGLASLAGYLAAGFFLSRTYVHPLYILFALFAAWRAMYNRDFGALKSGFERRDLKYVLAAAMLSIPALYVLMRFLW